MPASHSAGLKQGDKIGIFTDPNETYTHPRPFCGPLLTIGRAKRGIMSRAPKSTTLDTVLGVANEARPINCIDVGADWREAHLCFELLQVPSAYFRGQTNGRQ